MNCTQSQKMLDDYIDGNLSIIQFSTLNSHLNKCDDCRAKFIQAKNLIITLKDMPVPPAKPGYEQRVLEFLEKEQIYKKTHYSWFVAGFGAAIAATLTMWLNISSVPTLPADGDSISTVNLVVQQTRKVDLVFNLPDDLLNATLTIELPEKVEIAGYPGKRQLQWNTSLKKGSNRLALPLIAKTENSGMLIAHLTKNGKTKMFRINLDTKRPATSLLNNQGYLNYV